MSYDYIPTRWIAFSEKYPRPLCGVLIKFIYKPENMELRKSSILVDYKTENRLFYGYAQETNGYVFIIKEILDNKETEPCQFKAFKEHGEDEVFWLYDSALD